MSFSDDEENEIKKMEDEIKRLEDELDYHEEQLNMLLEFIAPIVCKHQCLSEHCKELDKNKNKNEEYIKSQKLELENVTKQWEQLKKERCSHMDSIDIINCKIGMAEMAI